VRGHLLPVHAGGQLLRAKGRLSTRLPGRPPARPARPLRSERPEVAGPGETVVRNTGDFRRPVAPGVRVAPRSTPLPCRGPWSAFRVRRFAVRYFAHPRFRHPFGVSRGGLGFTDEGPRDGRLLPAPPTAGRRRGTGPAGAPVPARGPDLGRRRRALPGPNRRAGRLRGRARPSRGLARGSGPRRGAPRRVRRRAWGPVDSRVAWRAARRTSGTAALVRGAGDRLSCTGIMLGCTTSL